MEKYRYKDSGIEWLGKIPKHWKVTKPKNIGVFETSSVNKKKDEKLPTINLINYMDVYSSKNKYIDSKTSLMQMSATKTQIKVSQVNKGDVLFTPSSETIDDIGHSAVIDEELENTLFSYHIIRLQFNEKYNVNNKFKRFLFNNHLVQNQLSSLTKGITRMTLKQKDFRNIDVPLPPFQEQKAIAEYLNKATVKIDRIIAIKQEQLVIIEETYISIRHKLITQGKNHTEFVSYDDDFLKKVPKSWKKWKLRYLLKLKNGKLIKNDELVDDGKFPVYGGNGIMAYTDKYNYKNELIIIGRVGAKCGNVYYTDQKIWVSDNAIAVRSSINYGYTYHLLNVLKLNRLASDTAQPLLVGNNVKKLYVAIPKVKEQEEIVEYLDNYTDKLEKTKANLKSQIETLQVYRKSLIHECVTGKKQVTFVINKQAYA